MEGTLKIIINAMVNYSKYSNYSKYLQKMEEMVKVGLTKSIGVSNFNKSQIQRLLTNSTIKPANVQVEVHVYFQQNDLIDFCKENEIVVTAYAPLGSKGIEDLNKMAGYE